MGENWRPEVDKDILSNEVALGVSYERGGSVL